MTVNRVEVRFAHEAHGKRIRQPGLIRAWGDGVPSCGEPPGPCGHLRSSCANGNRASWRAGVCAVDMCALAKQSPYIVTLGDTRVLRGHRTGRLSGEIRIIKCTGAWWEGSRKRRSRWTGTNHWHESSLPIPPTETALPGFRRSKRLPTVGTRRWFRTFKCLMRDPWLSSWKVTAALLPKLFDDLDSVVRLDQIVEPRLKGLRNRNSGISAPQRSHRDQFSLESNNAACSL